MSLVLKDRVRETTTVLGTNDATLLGAVTGFQAFSVVGNGNTCYYTISDQSGGNWEVGIGTYSTVGPTLARTTILASSNSGSIVSFPAGTKDVFLTLPAEVAVVSSNNPSTAGYVLSSNGTGVAPSWVAGTSITVGAAGSNTQVQYNNSGVLGASSNFTFDGTNIGLAGGTANGVAYLNGSKVLTTGSALTFDGTVFTVTKPTAYNTRFAYDASYYTDIGYGGTNTVAPSNPFYYWNLNSAEQMRLTTTGLGIGTSSPRARLTVTPTSNGQTPTPGTAVDGAVFTNSGNLYGTQFSVSSSGATYVQGQRFDGNTTTYPIYLNYSGGAVYLGNNGAAVVDSSGNLGLGVTPSAWGGGYKAFDCYYGALANTSAGSVDVAVTQNAYYNGTNWISKYTGASKRYVMSDVGHIWFNGASATAGNAISFTQAMTLDASGNLLVGATTALGSAANRGNITVNGTTDAVLSFGNAGSLAGYVLQDTGGMTLYSSGATYQRFYTNGTERMRIDSSGNVGIGTSSPASKLHIANAGDVNFRAQNTGSGSTALLGADSVGAYVGSFSNFPTVFYTNSTERMRIDSSGNLGLGVTPSAWQVTSYKVMELGWGTSLLGQTDAGNTILGTNYYLNSSYQYIYKNTGVATRYNQYNGQHQWFNAPSGTAGDAISFTQAMTLDASGNLLVGTTSPTYGNTNRGLIEVNGSSESLIAFKIGGSSTNSVYQYNTTSSFETNVTGARYCQWAVNGSERMRITSSGYLLVGTSNTSGAATNRIVGQSTGSLLALMVDHNASDSGVRGIGSNCPNYSGADGYLYIGNAGGVDKFYVKTSGNVQNTNNSYGAISDVTLKENIVDATPKLADLLKVRIRNYNLIEDESKTKQIGVVAQELEEVFPGLVETYTPPEGDEQIKSVKYSVFVPMLIKAIQELKAELDATKAEVAALKGN